MNHLIRRHNAVGIGYRRGIGLIEVLIVIGIIGLLLSLAFPAIQASREAGRKTQCVSNLRQVGLGLLQYHDAHSRFPPAVIWSPAGEPLGEQIVPPGAVDRISAGLATEQHPDRLFANWLIMLLPFVEEQALYDAYHPKQPVGSAENLRVRAAVLPTLLCPSDAFNGADNPFQRRDPRQPDEGYARSNYAMNTGPNERCLVRLSKRGKLESCPDGFQVNGTNLLTDTTQVWGSGIGGVNRSFRLNDFSGGSSKAVAIDEIRAGINALDRRGAWALGLMGCSLTGAHGLKGNQGPNRGSDRIQGCTLLVRYTGDSQMRGMPCATKSNPLHEICEQATARSQHPLGVHVLMADNSAHFVADEIDANLWEAIHKRNNNVPLALEFEE